MNDAMRHVSHSAIQTFKGCRKRSWFERIKRLRPLAEGKALRFGRVVHNGIARLTPDSTEGALIFVRTEQQAIDDPFDIATIVALLVGYHEAYYPQCSLIVATIDSEREFLVPICNPVTGRASRTFVLKGKIDAVVQLTDGRLANKETKTTGDDVNDPKLWRRLLVDPQVNTYRLAMPAAETTIYDLIHKPGMSPLKATPPEKRKHTKTGQLYANQREYDETPNAWEDRLLADIRSRPEFYYVRREVVGLTQDLDLFRHELWDVTKDIREAERTGRWYRTVSRNTCDFCPFFDLCVGLTVWDEESIPEGFERRNGGNTDDVAANDTTCAAACVT